MNRLLDDYLNSPRNGNNSHIASQKLTQISNRKALKLFHKAAIQIPAYKDFLKKNKVNPNLVKTFSDFAKVPVMTKENYIKHYTPTERSWNGEITNNHMISLSSGTTGEPVFWPRDLKSEINGASQHEYLFKNILNILNEDKKTMIVNGFAMGNWIAGTFTYASLYLLCLKGYKFTIATPGYSLEEVLKILNNFYKEYDQFVIAGHTPFLREVAENIKDIAKSTRIILIGTGQSISENWRKYILNLLGSQDYMKTFISLYGSTDAALMGYETPISIFIRSKFYNDKKVSKQLFNNERFPALYQFDPRITYFESIEGELHITKYSGSPLIRYNIQDRGGVLGKNELLKQLPGSISFEKVLPRDAEVASLPFVYLYGRDKFMVKIYGANIYSENVESILLKKYFADKLSGRFLLEVVEDEKFKPKLVCRFELVRNYKYKILDLKNKILVYFIEEIPMLNSEYSYILKHIGKDAYPEIILLKYGDSAYFPLGKIIKTS